MSDNQIYDFVYFIPSFNRFYKVQKLINSILSLDQRLKIILINDGTKDGQYNKFSNYDKNLIYLENEKNLGINGYWRTVNRLFNKSSKLNFNYGIMLNDDFVLISDFEDKLNSIINQNYIVRLFTQVGASKNWGYENWVDGAFCAPYNFFHKINFKIEPVTRNANMVSSGVGLYLTKKVNEFNFKVKDFGSLVIHDGNEDSVMHSDIRKITPLVGTEFRGE